MRVDTGEGKATIEATLLCCSVACLLLSLPADPRLVLPLGNQLLKSYETSDLTRSNLSRDDWTFPGYSSFISSNNFKFNTAPQHCVL